MKRWITQSCTAMLLLAGSAAAAERVALVGATIVDGNGGAAIADGAVLLDGDRIVAAGSRRSVAIPPTARTVDVSGKWITPGLIDAHIHFFQSAGLYTRPDGINLSKIVPYRDDLDASKRRLDETFARYLGSGVTTVIDAGGPLWNFEVRDRARVSSRAPRVAVAGPLIATEPTPNQRRLDLGDPPIVSAGSADEARRMALALLPRRPDFIKIWGIGSGPQGDARVRDITRAVAAVAHPAGIRVAVHATTLATAEAALDGGADILVHSVEDAAVSDSFIRKLKARNVVYVTTAMVLEGYSDALLGRPDLLAIERTNAAPDILATLYEMPAAMIAQFSDKLPPDPLPQILANALKLAASGARVAAGTDAGNIGTLHGPALHRELQLLSRAGLTPAQVLTAATRDAAFAYAAKPDVGLIAPGYRADLLVLDADPLQSVTNLGRIAQVWSRGVAHDPATLIPDSPERIVQRQLERYNAHDIEGFLATYADDVRIFDLPVLGKPSISGKAEMRRIYGNLFKRSPGPQCRGAQRMVDGRFVIDQEVCVFDASGKPLHASAIYEVVNGRIQHVWFAEAEAAMETD